MEKLRAVSGRIKKMKKDKRLTIDYLQALSMKMYRKYSRKHLDRYVGIIIYWK